MGPRCIFRLLCAVTILVAISACKTTTIPARLRPVETELGEGWQCFSSPDAFKKAGVVLEQTPDGRYFYDSDHSDLAVSGPSGIGQTHYSTSWTLGAVASLLQRLKIVDSSTKASLNLQRSTTVDVSYGGTLKHVIGGAGVKAVDSAYSGKHLKSTSRYLLIRESQSADSIDIQVNKGAIDSALVGISVDSLVNANLQFAKVDNATYKLQETFQQPVGICTLAYQLVLDSGLVASVASTPVKLSTNAAIQMRR